MCVLCNFLRQPNASINHDHRRPETERERERELESPTVDANSVPHFGYCSATCRPLRVCVLWSCVSVVAR